MRTSDERLETRLREAVRAAAPDLPVAFERNMGLLIDHLPRKERPVMKRKMSIGLAIALLLCLLTVGALAVALLSNRELVEQEVLPMAQENDASGLNEVFTHEELGRILALAEENGISLDANGSIRKAYARGDGYWEEEVIMAIAKDAFGPYPGQWTLEEQFWFEEVMVAIGFKDYNAARIPGENDLTYDAAYNLAKEHLLAEYGIAGEILDDRGQYKLWRGYHAYLGEEGSIQPPTWYFWFEPKDVALTEYELKLDRDGAVFYCQVTLGLQPPAENTPEYMTYYIRDRFEGCYGPMDDWPQDVWVMFGQQMKGAADAEGTLWAQVEYIPVPEGGLTREEAYAAAMTALDGPADERREGSAVCMMDEGQPIWKVQVWQGPIGARLMEIDCMTGEVLRFCPQPEATVGRYVPQRLWVTWAAQ